MQNVSAAGAANNKIIISAAGAHDMTLFMPVLFKDYPGLRVEWHLPNSPESLRKMIGQAKTMGWPIRIDGDSQDPLAQGHFSGWSTGPTVPQAKEMYSIFISEVIQDYNFFNNYGENKDPLWESIDNALAGDAANPDSDPWNVLKALAGK